MFGEKSVPLFVCAVFFVSVCEGAFVNSLNKCKLEDKECLRNLLQTVFRDIGKTGIPELGIPPVDPFPVKNVTVSVLNLLDITMIDGVAKGFKDCIVDRLETDFANERATMEMTCDLTIKGHYKVLASSPLIQNLLGGDTIHGDGFGKVTIEKFHVKFDYHVLVKSVDGEIYLECHTENLKYSYSLGKVTFGATNLYLGNTEASGAILSVMNQNWKFIMDSFGKPFLTKAMDIAYTQGHKFFDVTPSKYFILDDLTPYIKKYE